MAVRESEKSGGDDCETFEGKERGALQFAAVKWPEPCGDAGPLAFDVALHVAIALRGPAAPGLGFRTRRARSFRPAPTARRPDRDGGGREKARAPPLGTVRLGQEAFHDSGGNTYIAGLTYSPDFPVTPGAFQTPRAASVIRMPSSPSSDRPETSSGQPISTA
jgi:hypothetical protein